MSQQIALLGMHDKMEGTSYGRACKAKGYDFHLVETTNEMLERLRGEVQHTRILMDLNLGNPGSEDITPAHQIQELVQPRVAAGNVKFVGISANLNAVEKAQKEGIPAEYKPDFNLERFLQ